MKHNHYRKQLAAMIKHRNGEDLFDYRIEDAAKLVIDYIIESTDSMLIDGLRSQIKTLQTELDCNDRTIVAENPYEVNNFRIGDCVAVYGYVSQGDQRGWYNGKVMKVLCSHKDILELDWPGHQRKCHVHFKQCRIVTLSEEA